MRQQEPYQKFRAETQKFSLRVLCISVINICLLLALMAGCSNSLYVPVSGKVTIEGKPLVGVNVQFQPTGGTLSKPNVGRGSFGLTDEQGRFALIVDADNPGAVPGKHRVTIAHPWGKKPRTPYILPQYNTETKLTFEVPPEGTEAANFELKSR